MLVDRFLGPDLCFAAGKYHQRRGLNNRHSLLTVLKLKENQIKGPGSGDPLPGFLLCCHVALVHGLGIVLANLLAF